jgi:hypothetical protein
VEYLEYEEIEAILSAIDQKRLMNAATMHS